MNDKELFRLAKAAYEKSYAPYSNVHVGAALLCKDGKVFTGCNVENVSYGGTICAERTACVKAVSEGETEFVSIAVTSDHGTAWPCGNCRQFLSEFGTELRVISGDSEDNLTVYTLKELLPEAFAGF